MRVVWTYTRTYNHIEYYFFYPDLYMEWLCTYWINGVKTRSERQELLSLLCLELSAILDEDPDEAWETIQKANMIKEKAPGRAKGTAPYSPLGKQISTLRNQRTKQQPSKGIS